MNICYVISPSSLRLPKFLFEKLKNTVYDLVTTDGVKKFIYSSYDAFSILFFDALDNVCDFTRNNHIPREQISVGQAVNKKPQFCIAFDKVCIAEQKAAAFKNSVLINLYQEFYP